MVPKNMTHLLQPFNLSTNSSMKEIEKKCFNEQLAKAITKEINKYCVTQNVT